MFWTAFVKNISYVTRESIASIQQETSINILFVCPFRMKYLVYWQFSLIEPTIAKK